MGPTTPVFWLQDWLKPDKVHRKPQPRLRIRL